MQGVMEIEVSITRCTKPFVGLITGTDAKYGFSLDFVREIERKSSKHHIITVIEPGLYKTTEDVTIGNRGITSGYFQVTTEGDVIELTKEQVISLI